MRICLSSRSIPELASLPKAQREEVWQRCHPKGFGHWQTKAAFCALLVVWFGGLCVAVFAQPEDGFSWAQFTAGNLLIALGHIAFFSIHAHFARRYIRDELKK